MSSSIVPPISSLSRGALALALGAFFAALSTIFIFYFQPDFFGSGFEGSSGYMAVFVYTPLVALALSPICWVLLRRAGPLPVLLLWFVLAFVTGWFIGLFSWLLCGWLAWRSCGVNSSNKGSLPERFGCPAGMIEICRWRRYGEIKTGAQGPCAYGCLRWRSADQITPWACMASATFTKPAILAPSI